MKARRAAFSTPATGTAPATDGDGDDDDGKAKCAEGGTAYLHAVVHGLGVGHDVAQRAQALVVRAQMVVQVVVPQRGAARQAAVGRAIPATDRGGNVVPDRCHAPLHIIDRREERHTLALRVGRLGPTT